MNSVQKVRQALDRAEELAQAPDADPQVRIAGGVLMMSRGTLEQLLPQDPGQLDELLERFSGWLTTLLSDPAQA